ncbi:hypothetical protein GOV06_05515 [Candidatus Woesearchaeota archaeon]|nr:hypothetical protein [Candidatus Woesearchaeota archaeon]
MKSNIKLPTQMSEDLAELIGIILGDGNLHKKYNLITIVGSLEDIHYYKNRVIPLIKSLFNINPKLRKRNDRNAYYIDFYSKDVMDFLVKVGLKREHKKSAGIPKIIKENDKLLIPLLRGLFDTDGCLKFSKQTRDYNYYPRIRLCFQDSPLIKDLKDVFKKINFNYGFNKDARFNTFYFEISGKSNLEKWMKLIGMNNPVHKSKYLFWKKFGYYIPRSTLKSRLKALNLNTSI